MVIGNASSFTLRGGLDSELDKIGRCQWAVDGSEVDRRSSHKARGYSIPTFEAA